MNRFEAEQEAIAKPFLKWAGGKSQLLGIIRTYYPKNFGTVIKKYCEPMVGAGAVLFDILNNFDVDEVMINDSNSELINVYIQIKDNSGKLIDVLKLFENEFINKTEEQRKKYYYKKRELYNNLIFDKNADDILKAALFIFLNKTCFNGLYRVNRQGKFNVPMGSYKKPLICDENNLLTVSKKLQKVIITVGDYKQTEQFIDENTFVYFDPPYRPLSKTSGFVSYTEENFDDQKQIELAEYIIMSAKKGAKILASNSDPKTVNKDDDFFDELYKMFIIDRVKANRSINSVAENRSKITELLITNITGEKKMRDFNKWLTNFRSSIASYDYYIDFEKVYRNVDNIKVELNILNSLVGSETIEEDFEKLIIRYPEILKCIPLLIAVRSKEIYAVDADGECTYSFKKAALSADEYKVFMRKTGLFELISNRIVSNLVDYATGVETGLDSNGRKNRGGHLMENLVEEYIQKAGFIKDENYFKEMYIHQITDKWGIDLSAISNQGKTEKRFDFVVKTDKMIYVIETNFYASGGSKLNETARSYKTLAGEVDTIDGLTFVWFTDGKGWTKARHNLEETFDVMDNIYNIYDMENGVIKEVFK